MRKPTFWFPTRSDTNRDVQPLKIARGLKFRIYESEGLHYLCSENKGADQFRGHREADLRLCFRICKKAGFLMTELICKHDRLAQLDSNPIQLLFQKKMKVMMIKDRTQCCVQELKRKLKRNPVVLK